MKVIIKCVNIKLWDILGSFHYILNAPRKLKKCSKFLELDLNIFWSLKKCTDISFLPVHCKLLALCVSYNMPTPVPYFPHEWMSYQDSKKRKTNVSGSRLLSHQFKSP